MKAWFVVGLVVVACGRVGFRPLVDDSAGAGDGGARDGALGDAAPADDATTSLVDGASASCPAAIPACGLDPCSEAISCTYQDGTCCACDGVGPAWVCLPPSQPGCPATEPTLGAACSPQGLTCGYCEVFEYQCNTVWKAVVPC